MKMGRYLLVCAIVFAGLERPAISVAQAQPAADDPPGADRSLVSTPSLAPYTPLSQTQKFHNYLFDAFGPYPTTVTAFMAGYHQATRNPPDWREGFTGYYQRFGSDFGTSAAGVTASYLVAEALHENTLYYECNCKGVWRRLKHAVVSTLVARQGEDGHKVFSFAALAEPYAGSFAAVYGWYPSRYGAKDAFRLGNYGLLTYAANNVTLEFFPAPNSSGRNSWINRLHLDNRHDARQIDPAP